MINEVYSGFVCANYVSEFIAKFQIERRKFVLMLVGLLCLISPFALLHAAETDDINVSFDKRELVIASSNNFPPINALDDNGQLIGFASDMSRAVAKAIGVEVTYRHSGIWTDVLKWLDTGEADLIHDTGYTKERESYLDFTDAIIEMPESIVVRDQQLDINSLSSLYGKKVACVNRHITHIYLQKFKEIKCHLVNTPAEGLIALINGNVEAFIYPEQIVFYLAQHLKLSKKIKVIGEPLRILSWSMTVKNGNDALLKRLNQGIKIVKESGEYKKIYNKWFGKKLFSGYSHSDVTIIIVTSVLISLLFALIVGLVIYTRRIKGVNQRLLESENKYRTLADKLPQSIFLKDVNLSYVSCNQKYADSLGIEPNEIVGKNDYDFHPENAEEYRDGDRLILKTGKTHEFDETYFEGRKKLYIHTVKTPVYSEKGNIVGVLGIFTDLTEQKNLQNQLFQSQKMESIGQLTGGIAHDFNNMLGSILGYTELAKDYCKNEPESKLNNYLAEIYRAGERGRDLVSEMLAFGRTTSSDIHSVNAELIIKDVLKLLKPSLPSSLIIDVEIATDAPFVFADVTQLHQIITNLILNAHHAIGGEGKIELRLQKSRYIKDVCDSCHHDFSGEFVELSVHDNGQGIQKENIEHIFEPFYTTKGVGEGSGLGLSMVHGILHQCNGHITVETEKNIGTRFSLFLEPAIAEQNHPVVDEVKVIEPMVNNKTIMVVDDEIGITGFISELLKSKGYTVRAFNDSLDALNVFKASPDSISLVITDQTMPNLTGIELAQEILLLRPQFPIILCTGYSEKVNEEKARQLGVSHFMQKPVSTDQLLNNIAMLLTTGV